MELLQGVEVGEGTILEPLDQVVVQLELLQTREIPGFDIIKLFSL